MAAKAIEGLYIAKIAREYRDPLTGAERYGEEPELLYAVDRDDLEAGYIAGEPEFIAETGDKTRLIYDRAARTAYLTTAYDLAGDALEILGPDEDAANVDGQTITWRDELEDATDEEIREILENLDMPIVTIDVDMHRTRGVEHVKILHL